MVPASHRDLPMGAMRCACPGPWASWALVALVPCGAPYGLVNVRRSGVRAGGRWSRRASPWNKAAACGQARAGQGQAFEGEIRSRLFAECINAVFHTAKNLWRIWTGLAPDGKARAIPLARSERRAGRGVQGPPRASAQRCRRCRPWSQQATESALGPLEMAPAGTGPGRLTCGEDRHVRPGGALDGDGQRSGGVLLLPAVRVCGQGRLLLPVDQKGVGCRCCRGCSPWGSWSVPWFC